MRSPRLLTAVLLTLAGVAFAGATVDSASAAPSKDLTIRHPHPMKNEYFTAYGELSTNPDRPIKLQTLSGSTWKTVVNDTTHYQGEFAFSTRTSKNRTYRFYAPAVTINGKSYQKVVGNPKKVTLASQSGSAVVIPYAICDYNTTRAIAVVAHFSPARVGRTVTLRSNGHSITGSTDPKGNVILDEPEADNSNIGANYVKVTASSYDGSAAKTVTAKFVVKSCDE